MICVVTHRLCHVLKKQNKKTTKTKKNIRVEQVKQTHVWVGPKVNFNTNGIPLQPSMRALTPQSSTSDASICRAAGAAADPPAAAFESSGISSPAQERVHSVMLKLENLES